MTGDHQATATAIARDVEIIGPDSSASAVMPASQFNAMSEAEIDALPELPLVIARCDPDVSFSRSLYDYRRANSGLPLDQGTDD